MASISPIVPRLVAEIRREHKLPKIIILQIISDALDEIIKRYEQRPAAFALGVSEALDRIKAVTVTRGDAMPAYQLEALKELIKKVALRKISQLEEHQLKEQKPGMVAHGKRRRQKTD